MAAAHRSRAGRVAALTRWAHESDPQAATAPARKGFLAKFEREVDPDGTMPPGERLVRAERLMKAHMSRLAGKAAEARRRKGRAA